MDVKVSGDLVVRQFENDGSWPPIESRSSFLYAWRQKGQMAKTENFRAELNLQLSLAEGRGAPSVEINSGELHRKVGGYPGANHAMPSCCNVMYGEQRVGDKVLSSPPLGRGASLTIRYKLPR